MIAIPTTAGTAAEVTINYVITDVENRRKFVCYDPHAIPVVAIIDADMMASMPPSLKAATGVDALTHAIEGYITKGAWELTDTLHLKAIEMIGRSLRGSIQESPMTLKAWRWGSILPGWASLMSDWAGAWNGPSSGSILWYATRRRQCSAIAAYHGIQRRVYRRQISPNCTGFGQYSGHGDAD